VLISIILLCRPQTQHLSILFWMAKLEQPSIMPPTDRTLEERTSSNGNRPSYNVEQHHSNIVQPLHPSSTNQTPVINMPSSARQSTTQFNHHVMNFQAKHSSASSTPDTFKNTPITVQMTPDFDVTDDLISGTVSKQLCSLLSSEGNLDASSTEAADSSKSSEYEISEGVLLQFGRDPSSPRSQKVSSRSLFSIDGNDHDDVDNDNDNITECHYSDIIIESASNSYDTPNHSIVTSSPNSFDRASSEGQVSPIHLPKQKLLHQQRHSISLPYPSPNANHSESCTNEDDALNATRHNIYEKNNPRKQLRSRRSLRSELLPKSFDRIAGKQHRSRKVGKSNINCPRSGSKNVDDEEYSADADYPEECFSTDTDDDDYINASTRLKYQQRLSSSSSATRRKSSITNPTTKRQNYCKNISQRLSTTENLIWMLCFVGLTSVTMIVTMHHHMSRVSEMDRRDHVSVLFRNPTAYRTKTRRFAFPPSKLTTLVLPKPTSTTSVQTKQIRGAISAGKEVKKSESKNRRTVNLNTIAQLPLDNVLHKVSSSNILGQAQSSNDYSLSSSRHHDHQHDHHHHHDDRNRHHTHITSNHRQYSYAKSSSNTITQDGMKPKSNDHAKVVDESHHHHHHSHSDSKALRVYVTARPIPIGVYLIPKVSMPELWDDDEVQPSFDLIDPILYMENFETTESTMLPRVVFIDGEDFSSSKDRIVRRYRSEITDSTQLYSILDSADERIASMELRAPYVQGECVPMKEWQTTFNPSCNGMHELDLANMGDNRMEDDFKLFGMNGFWRNAWRYDSTGGHSTLTERDTVVLKTYYDQKYIACN
jgi:hypothetical protein